MFNLGQLGQFGGGGGGQQGGGMWGRLLQQRQQQAQPQQQPQQQAQGQAQSQIAQAMARAAQQGGGLQQRTQSPFGGAPGGMAAMLGRQQQAPQQMQAFRAAPQAGGMASAMGGMRGAMALSDERSKTRIRDLQDRLDETHAALTADHADYPEPRGADTDALDSAYRRASSNTYEYKDPAAEGAAPGRQAGPMAQELRPIPGVVQKGPDGYDRVDTGRLSLANASQIGRQRRELDDLNERLAALSDDPDAVLDAAAGRRRR